jgi:hypothetical protein
MPEGRIINSCTVDYQTVPIMETQVSRFTERKKIVETQVEKLTHIAGEQVMGQSWEGIINHLLQ